MKKPSKCKQCGKVYQKFQSTQKACSIECAFLLGKKDIAKRKAEQDRIERKINKERIDANRPLSFFAKTAQAAFNAYIRERDKDLPCISCGNTRNVKYCAGHFYTRGARPWLAFNEDNVHKQCDWHCNMNLSGNIINYRPALIAKIGLERVEALDNSTGADWKPTREMYREIERTYKKKKKELGSPEPVSQESN